ncbi:ABC transporter C family member 10-like isoform X2 [Primulina tabacum]|uniref:ABC transporter C family member 10-like isoform X2 n=1 Tax=Primulina tabacum TaxID=48773 RepID=UPI003F59DE47
MGNLWTVFCGESNIPRVADLIILTRPSSCADHVLILCFDILLLIVNLFTIVFKKSLKSSNVTAATCRLSSLQIVSAILNGSLGLVYLCFGVWILEEKLRKTRDIAPLHSWTTFVFHGLIWLLIGLTVSVQGTRLRRASLRLLTFLAFLFSGVTCGFSLYIAILGKEMRIKNFLDVLSFIGSCLLLLCTYKGNRHQGCDDNDIRDPLLSSSSDDCKTYSSSGLNPFTEASFWSKLTFWWLNPLLKRGTEKTLSDEDMPSLHVSDRAESCYLSYLEILDRRKQSDRLAESEVLMTIELRNWREIVISGFFALLKVISVSAGPLLLKAFIKVAEGNESFGYAPYILVATLFLAKIVESISQRQWYFRSKLVGLRVRSLLTAVIYQKQLRLSNSAKLNQSSGQIMNYVTVDSYRIGEFPFWLHQIWTTSLQLCLAIVILFQAVGLATIASMAMIILIILCNSPIGKLQHKFQSKLTEAQDERLKKMSEAILNMKVLKLSAWETHFREVVEKLRAIEEKCLCAVQLCQANYSVIFWSSSFLVSSATFATCYFLGVPLSSTNVFTFVATLQLVQEPVRLIPDVIAVFIQAKVAFSRIVKFLGEPELETASVRVKSSLSDTRVSFQSADLSWDENPLRLTLRNISLGLKHGDKIAVCGEVGSGKSTLLAAILGEVPITAGTVQVHGTIAYVSQSAWIQTGSIRENILFGSTFDNNKYQDTLNKCSLLKDLELLPYGDLTEIGERGVTLSGGQKQRIQLARAMYKDADIYLLDDPFSAVDAHTALSLFNEYVLRALSTKTVVLVTHQVDFLRTFDYILFMSDGKILHAAPYPQLLATSQEFRDLVNAHKETAGSEMLSEVTSSRNCGSSSGEIRKKYAEMEVKTSENDSQLIKKEEREVGDSGLKPYILYLNHDRGFFLFSVAALSHLISLVGQIMQNTWMAANVDDRNVTTLRLIVVYLLIGLVSALLIICRSISTVVLNMKMSRALFSQLLMALFRAPMSFYDSTPLGRILSRVSSDLSVVDLDVPFSLLSATAMTSNCYSYMVVLAVITWQVLLVTIPMIFIVMRLQRYYFSSARELMRINGTTKSLVANHLAESMAGVITIRAFEEEDRFFAKYLQLIDTNGSPYFHYFSANEWLIQRLEILCATVLSFAALCMVLLPTGTLRSGFIGMSLSYGLALNSIVTFSINTQCLLSNYIVSVERLDQYMRIPSEALEVIEENHPPIDWPTHVILVGKQIRYRSNSPLVLRGISCVFEGGHKVGIVGRTGSGKTTLISALFRLVEPAGGKILVDGVDISRIGLHDLRSRLGIIPQDPTLFNGTVRYNLDPLGEHTEQELLEVLGKCQLKEAIGEKKNGLDSQVVEDGSNWSMGQRQLFCLGRALLRRSKILVLDEATASIDNATDMILQKIIRTEFADCTVITVAHRIPTVMYCNMVLAISEGKLVEYDEPMNLMKREDTLFGQLVQEYWSHHDSAE